VLIVDDDVPLARALGRVLRGAGAEVTLATSATEGLRQLDEHRPDALVTDFQLADGDGLALLRRASRMQPAVPTAMVTALTDPSLVELATSMGACTVLQKPFAPSRLVAVLSHLLRSVT
jgi:DNA-binding response OmpR family regulator